jgi:hypothetical protein
MRKIPLTAATVAIAGAGLLGSTAAASASVSPAIYHSTNCSASGSGAECFTGNGGIRNPTGGVFVKVTSSPSGRNVTVGWDVSCGNSSSDPSFTNRTTHTYRVHLPTAHPKFCTISGFAFINGSARGTIHLSIFYYR